MGNSFYGGQDARPFIITKEAVFATVQEMVAAFSRGLAYTTVNFEDYVLINCQNKNNPENGMIFRRGYDVNSNRYITSYTPVPINENDSETIVKFTENPKTLAYGAEYIGTIVGPAGGAPLVKMYNGLIENIPKITENEYEGVTFEGGESIVLNKDNKGLVSGKDNKDEIQWNYYSLRGKNNESTTLHIGFQIPYPVFEMSAKHISPYDTEGNIVDYSEEGLLTDEASGRIYYKNWKLNIPKGIKGDSVNIEYIGSAESNDLGIKFTTTNYDESESGNSSSKTFNYNIIDKVDFSPEGVLTIGLTSEDDKVFDKPETKVTWLKEASLSDNGDLKFTFNNNKITNINKTLNWVKSAGINDKGLLQIDFINNKGIVPNKKEDYPNSIILTSIDSMSISETGLLKYKLTDGEGEKSLQIPIIESTDVSNGKLKIKYKHSNTPVEAIGTLKQIDSIVRDTTAGELIFNYTVGKPDKISFPQDFYLRNKETPPENAPDGSIWAVIETKTIKSQEVSS
jgi:hypothetical protein